MWFFWLYGIIVPQIELKSAPLALKVWNVNLWTTREIRKLYIYIKYVFKNTFIHLLFLAVLVLRCFMEFSLVVASGLLIQCLFIAVVSLVEHGLQ